MKSFHHSFASTLSFAFSVFLEHGLLSVKEWIEEDHRESLHSAMQLLNLATGTH